VFHTNNAKFPSLSNAKKISGYLQCPSSVTEFLCPPKKTTFTEVWTHLRKTASVVFRNPCPHVPRLHWNDPPARAVWLSWTLLCRWYRHQICTQWKNPKKILTRPKNHQKILARPKKHQKMSPVRFSKFSTLWLWFWYFF